MIPIMPTFLPGRFRIVAGTRADYLALRCFHYRQHDPRTWAAIWAIRYAARDAPIADERAIAVGVLSWPTAVNGGRDRAFRLTGLRYGQKIAFANANVRTISRVIVHPQFRSLGLASALVRWLCTHCPTRYVEASAQMGRAHPLFVAGGMTRITGTPADKPVYYLFDRERPSEGPNHAQAKPEDGAVDRRDEPLDEADRRTAGGDGNAA
ncbi:MAG TPA: GNAT family N-acetyltransferase [Tepidisphaeraceae bacterium]|jgi:GNAT superfamily N-acetyltransferase|nr:GNAT family N-acetyltransferase [Tepidisphaeraceae bacterium]